MGTDPAAGPSKASKFFLQEANEASELLPVSSLSHARLQQMGAHHGTLEHSSLRLRAQLSPLEYNFVVS